MALKTWKCPSCGEVISYPEETCGYCGANPSKSEREALQQRSLQRDRQVATFWIGLIVVLAPLVGGLVLWHATRRPGAAPERPVDWAREAKARSERERARLAEEASIAEHAKRTICSDSLLTCYDQYETRGDVAGSFHVHLDPHGHAISASFDRGDASPAIKRCMITAAKQLSVPEFSGGAASVTCEFAGSYGEQSSGVSWKSSFARARPRRSSRRRSVPVGHIHIR